MHATKRLLLLTSYALCIALAQTARADYFGLEVVERTDLPICQDTSEEEIPYKLDVCDVYAVFDDPADQLISVAFSDGSTNDNNGFYQHSMHFTDTAPACALIALEPTAECDSYVTIGVDCGPGSPGLDGTTLDPDWSTSLFNSSGEIAGGWFNSVPDNGQGTPDANGNVLVAQFSVKQNKNSSGTLTVFARLAGSDDITEYSLESFDCSTASSGSGGGTSGSSGGAPEPQGQGGGACPAGMIWYVNEDNDPGEDSCCTAAEDCTEWADACPDLQSVLDNVASGDQIWVAEGTYKPTKRTNLFDLRTATFQLASCLAIYGGFEGTEEELEERDYETNVTILSGEIQSDDYDLNNTYHVVTAGSGTSSVDVSAILDGFTVTKGYASGTFGGPNGPDQGSAVSIWIDSTPKLENCTFYYNYSLNHGAVNDHGGATLTNCVFDYNHGHALGGGLYVHSDIETTVTDCDFIDNWSHGEGGGAYVKQTTTGPEPEFTGCTFTGNEALRGGGFYSGVGRSPSLSNCTFSSNTVTGTVPEGAAMYIDAGSPTISDCAFSDNEVVFQPNGKAGAIYIKGGSDPLIEGCTFTDNEGAGCGGAVYMGPESTPQFRDCQFTGNSSSSPASIYGGTIYNLSAAAVFVDCEIRDGVGRNGGAIYQDKASTGPAPSTDLINCIFINNLADDFGIPSATGGGALWGKDSGSFQLTNCLFVGNRATSISNARGGAVGVTAGTQLTATNCTFVANSAEDDGGGVWIGTSPASNTLDNCVFWDNTDTKGANDDESAQIHFDVSAPDVTYSDLMNLVPEGSYCPTLCGTAPDEYCCNGNIGDDLVAHDPKFATDPDPGPDGKWGTADDDYGDLHTTAGSPCIDAASNLEVPADVADLDEDLDFLERTPFDLDPKPRFIDDPDTFPDRGVPDPGPPAIPEVVDMGAYEFPADCGDCPTDIDGDGDTGPFDLAFLLGFWGHPITNADALCLDADDDLTLGPFDLAFLLGQWGACP